MRGVSKDLAFGVRTQLRAPAATVAIVAILAFAIAANAVAFALLSSFFIRPLPVRDPDRLVRLYTTYPAGPRYFTISFPDYTDIRGLGEVFAEALVEEPVPITVGVAGEYERVWGERVSDSYFSLLGVRPAEGRFFTAEEAANRELAPVAVIGYGLWQRRFGGGLSVLGQTLTLDGSPFTIIGVAPKDFQGTNLGLFPDLWLPLARAGGARQERGARGYFAMGRLRPGVRLEQARAALDVLARRLQDAYPDTNQGIRFTVLPEAEGRVHPMVRGGILGFSGMLVAVAFLLLLLACANVAAVLLARGVSRGKEIGLRLALGATRGRIVRQLLIEGAMVAVLAGAAGVALAWSVTRLLSSLPLPTARGAPLAFDIGLDARVLGFSLAVTAITGVLFGLAPALAAARHDLVAVMREGEGTLARRPTRLRNVLVAVQVTLSLTLLMGGGLFLRSLQNAQHVDLGFDPFGLVVTSVDLTPRAYPPGESGLFWRRLVDAVAALPRTESATLADRVPFEVNITTMSAAPEGQDARPGEAWPSIDWAVVDSGYFETLRIPLLEGRDFTERDGRASPPVVIVNEVLARQFWPGRAAVGRRLLAQGGPAYEVIGVARLGKYLTLGEAPKPYLYLALGNEAQTMTLVARGHGDAASFLREVRNAVRAVGQGVPVYNVATMADRMRMAFLPARAGALALNVVGLFALALTSLGLYGTVAYAVGRRTHEIGIRRALGARRRDILWLALRPPLLLVVEGALAGSLLGFVGSRIVTHLLYDVPAADPLAFGLAPVVLVFVSCVASGIPARRAVRIEPAVALRHE